MLKGIEEVCIIDSIVVDKDRFLEVYKISPESGKLFTYNDFFQNKEEVEATVYETELGNKWTPAWWQTQHPCPQQDARRME